MSEATITAITALLATTIPSLVTAVTAKRSSKDAELHYAKQSILQLILEDRFKVEVYHKSPENYQAVMKEFDIYTKAGGNSYVHDKVVDYEKWYNEVRLVEPTIEKKKD